MPVPIRTVGLPISERKDSDSLDMFLVDVDALAGALGGHGKSAAISVSAEATDDDASLLLDLFNRGTIVSEAESVEDKKYAVPGDFPSDKLLRLKAASLVSGDAKVVRFTPKAVRVIKTLVLAEQNAYAGRSVSKPYSVILAENRARAASHSTLAFQKTAGTIPVVAQSNRPISSEFMPGRDTPYARSERLVKREGTANKHYIVRLFEVNGKWVVIAWNGRNEAGRPLAMQTKGMFDSRSQAEAVFADVVSSKTRSGYRSAVDAPHPDLLGSDPAAGRTSQPARVTGRPEARPSTQTAVPRTPPAARPATAPKVSPARAKPAEPKPAEPKPAEPDRMTPDQFIDSMLNDLSRDDDFLAP